MENVLIIDDDKPTLEAMSDALITQGYEVISKSSGKEALKAMQEKKFDVVLTDLKMPDIDGMDILKAAKDMDPHAQVILITAHGSIDTAVEAMRAGAADFIEKPVKNLKELRDKTKKAIERQIQSIKEQNVTLQNQNMVLQNQNTVLQQQINEKFGFSNIIGNSKPMHDIFDQLRLVAPTKANVLIYGETGTGKELIAHAIHSNSPRKDKPFIPINCAAISSSLLESELFGHEKGAFTGAIKQRQGAFELANEGTLLLDEVSEMSVETQAKFLRVGEDQQFMRLGGTKPISVDIRIISATNKDLAKEIETRRFREDLYYRLKVITVNIPPLRQRKEDIPLLIHAFINEFSKENNKNVIKVEKETLDKMVSYDWPGNVRELRNCIESMVIMSQSDTLKINDLPFIMRDIPILTIESSMIGISIDEMEKEAIKRVLEITNGELVASKH
jgi:DNA-binding NtrC family response regulator